MVSFNTREKSMHFPTLSSTLPRRWKIANTDVVSSDKKVLSSDKKPPKSSSSLRRRFSSLSTTSSGLPSYGSVSSQKAAKHSQPSSHLARASSFSNRASSEPSAYYGEKSSFFRNNSHLIRNNNSSKPPNCNGSATFDFKKPLPPPPKPQLQRRSFLQGVLTNKAEQSPLPIRRCSDTSSLYKNSVPLIPSATTGAKEWKSQSLVDLYGNTSEYPKSHTLITVKPDKHRPTITSEKTKFSNPFHTFGTPQVKRKVSAPVYLSSSLTDPKGGSKYPSFYSNISSQDGINKVPRELQGSSSSLSQPGISTATIFSKNLRSNSWRNLSVIGKVEPIQHEQKALREFICLKNRICTQLDIVGVLLL